LVPPLSSINYGDLYDQVYSTVPRYSQPDNSPSVRFYEYAKALAGDWWPSPLASLIDVGAGPGSLKSILPISTHYVSVDASTVAKPTIVSDITKDDPPPGSFDVVACFDVLEHVHEADLRHAVDYLSLIDAKFCIGSICMRDAIALAGKQLHLSVFRQPVWSGILKNGFRVIRTQVLGDDLVFAATNR
jgi:hypothetical protein